jgi:hypothetical protein
MIRFHAVGAIHRSRYNTFCGYGATNLVLACQEQDVGDGESFAETKSRSANQRSRSARNSLGRPGTRGACCFAIRRVEHQQAEQRRLDRAPGSDHERSLAAGFSSFGVCDQGIGAAAAFWYVAERWGQAGNK